MDDPPPIFSMFKARSTKGNQASSCVAEWILNLFGLNSKTFLGFVSLCLPSQVATKMITFNIVKLKGTCMLVIS